MAEIAPTKASPSAHAPLWFAATVSSPGCHHSPLVSLSGRAILAGGMGYTASQMIYLFFASTVNFLTLHDITRRPHHRQYFIDFSLSPMGRSMLLFAHQRPLCSLRICLQVAKKRGSGSSGLVFCKSLY